MSVPHLSRRIVLEAPVRTEDGAGGFRHSWIALGEVWAEMRAKGGREGTTAGVLTSQTNFVVTVRATPIGSPERPLPEQRFRDGTRVYAIQTVAEWDTSGRYLTCLVEEEVAT